MSSIELGLSLIRLIRTGKDKIQFYIDNYDMDSNGSTWRVSALKSNDPIFFGQIVDEMPIEYERFKA